MGNNPMVGATVACAVAAQAPTLAKRCAAKASFPAKRNIALKEISKTEDWLELLHATGYLVQKGELYTALRTVNGKNRGLDHLLRPAVFVLNLTNW